MTGNRVGKATREQYEPLLTSDEIDTVRNYIVSQVATQQTSGDVSQHPRERVRDSSEAIFENFEEARVLITLSPQSTTFIPRDPTNMYRGFRDQMDQLWKIAKSSTQPHLLIWIFSLGNQTFDDDGGSQARLFDLQNLGARFRALRLFDDPDAEERWAWLEKHAAILIHDAKRVLPAREYEPTSSFRSEHVLLRSNPDGWLLRSPEYRELFGRTVKPELLDRRNYTIFCGRQDDDDTPLMDADVQYVGHTWEKSGKSANVSVKGRELRSPGPDYDLAYRTVAAAAAHHLGIGKNGSANANAGQSAIDELKYHRIAVLNLKEFATYPD